MTTTLAPDARTLERRGRSISAWATVAGAWVIGMYFWIAVVIITVALTFVLHRWSDVEGSVAEGVLGSAPIFLGVMGVVLPLATLPIHLASGATRRSFARGIVVAAVAIGITFALAGAVGMLIESVAFGAFDWSTAIKGAGLYDSSGDFFGIWLSWALSCTAYFLGGTAIAVGYYRWGSVLGTAHMLLAVALVVGGEYALGGGVYSTATGAVLGDDAAGRIAVVAISLVSIGLLIALVRRAIRDVPLRVTSRSAC